MNLIKDGWIPVYVDGKTKSIGLKELYENMDTIEDLTMDFVQQLAIIRLLICITQAALNGPKDDSELEGCRSRIQSESLKYLKKWEDQFELYGKTAFLQVPDLDNIANRTLSYLFFKRATGDRHTLFDVDARGQDNETFESKDIALALLCLQMFSQGGLIQDKIFNIKSGKSSIPLNLLLTYIASDNLLDTIHSNLIPFNSFDDNDFPHITIGRPVWEQKITKNSVRNPNGFQKTYLYNLVPLTRSIRLEEGSTRCSLAEGIRVCGGDEDKTKGYPFYRDPMATVITVTNKNKTSKCYLTIDRDKAPWRELSSILAVHKQKEGAWTLKNPRRFGNRVVTIRTGGMSCSQAKIEDICRWSYQLCLGQIDESCVSIYAEEANYASSMGWALKTAIEEYANLSEKDKKKQEAKRPAFYRSLISRARRIFWTKLDAEALTLVLNISKSGGNKITEDGIDFSLKWRKFVKYQAIKAFESACHISAGNSQEYTQALQILERKPL